ncbi:DUF1905 domain-containing protein [Sphingomonas immobilis]|uniref:DUF1905 domain-containing protein n=1 Tax=Sphingomonas immobilis TaxID=3063997 RepID=A0ABT9A1K6_9SPHN|nr:DUF1905 domain-containing protein [Sphingomonas sp. CA1-15]MDO7842602.1 DUF1905 domain-containing protein [Sphingomonas sp. CA1-15]
MDLDPILTIAFVAPVIEWRGPAPFYFVPIPEEHVGAVADAARTASYGWGCVPVSAQIGGVEFRTSLFPRDGGYLLPVKAAVRKQTGLVPGDAATVEMSI